MSKRLELFVCPVCKMKNDESQKYCTGCGHWLLSETFSAKKYTADSKIDRLYICAFCDTANEPNRNACKKCMKPLFSMEYETREIKTKSGNRRSATSASNKTAAYIFPVIIIALLLLGLYKWDNAAKFDRIEVGDGQYVLSQFVVKRPLLRSPSAAADFTAIQDIKDPLEITAVFYSGDGTRLGTASAMLTNGITKNQMTTLNFAFDGVPVLSDLKQVRLEIKQASPLDLIERAADKLNRIPLK